MAGDRAMGENRVDGAEKGGGAAAPVPASRRCGNHCTGNDWKTTGKIGNDQIRSTSGCHFPLQRKLPVAVARSSGHDADDDDDSIAGCDYVLQAVVVRPGRASTTPTCGPIHGRNNGFAATMT
jgi:hypothetical protein